MFQGDFCSLAGFMLICKASSTSSSWHNFVSDVDHWKDENGETPCINSGGMYEHICKVVLTRYKLRFACSVLKSGSQEKKSFCCRCSSFLSLTFVEIKNSFTRTLLVFNSKNFRIIFYWKKTDENEPI